MLLATGRSRSQIVTGLLKFLLQIVICAGNQIHRDQLAVFFTELFTQFRHCLFLFADLFQRSAELPAQQGRQRQQRGDDYAEGSGHGFIPESMSRVERMNLNPSKAAR